MVAGVAHVKADAGVAARALPAHEPTVVYSECVAGLVAQAVHCASAVVVQAPTNSPAAHGGETVSAVEHGTQVPLALASWYPAEHSRQSSPTWPAVQAKSQDSAVV